MRKGKTSIISIIILLFIIVALAAAAFIFIQSYLSAYTCSVIVDEGTAVFCMNTGTENVISVQVTNKGQQELSNLDFSVVQIDSVNETPSLRAPLLPGEAGILIEANDCGGAGCSSGTHTVSIGTAEGVTTINVHCP